MPLTDKDRTITALQAEIESLRTIISMTPGNVFWKDVEGFYLGCNKNVADVLQLKNPEDIRGKHDRELIGEEFAKITKKIDSEVIEKKTEKCLEEIGFNTLGERAIYLTRKTPLFDKNHNVSGILGISFDITDRKLIEEKLKIAKQKAEAANQAKSNFLSTISHELRTPLTSILGFATLLEQALPPSSNEVEFAKHIIDSGNYLLSLINSLLDYNKLEIDKTELSHHPLNLKELVSNVVGMLEVTASAKKLPLHVFFDNSTPEFISSNQRVLRQVLINLIGNAIKFTEKGSIKVSLTCLNDTETTALIRISIEDTGIGISQSEQRHIFKRFTQLENIYTRNSSLTGTGLGLAIVKKLVKLLGGKIKLESTPNKGSTFYVDCPFLKATRDEIAQPTLEKITPTATKPLHVLLIEDNPLIQIIHKNMLEDLGCTVDITESANQALGTLSNNYAMLFVDIGLPDIAGFDLIKKIRGVNSHYAKVPIIVLTGYSEEQEHEHCLRMGANEIAIKPVKKDNLEKILLRYLSK